MAEFDKNMLNKVKKFFEKFFQKARFTIFTKELHAFSSRFSLLFSYSIREKI